MTVKSRISAIVLKQLEFLYKAKKNVPKLQKPPTLVHKILTCTRSSVFLNLITLKSSHQPFIRRQPSDRVKRLTGKPLRCLLTLPNLNLTARKLPPSLTMIAASTSIVFIMLQTERIKVTIFMNPSKKDQTPLEHFK